MAGQSWILPPEYRGLVPALIAIMGGSLPRALAISGSRNGVRMNRLIQQGFLLGGSAEASMESYSPTLGHVPGLGPVRSLGAGIW